MSARQAFVPHAPPESHSRSTDVRENDGGRDLFISGKPRSLTALLGQKTGAGTDTASQGTGPTKVPGLARTNSNRRGFEGIMRPEMTPMSIIPYPSAMQFNAAAKPTRLGQTPRKNAIPGAFDFSRPMTPESVPRGLKRTAIFAENREDEVRSNGNAISGARVHVESGEEEDAHSGAGNGMGGYMRMFDGAGGGGNASGVQSHLEHDIAAPVPGYAVGGRGESLADDECEANDTFARASESFDAMNETEARMERNHGPQRGFGGTKRGIRREDVEDHHQQGPEKRMKRVHHNSNEYSPISTPRIAPSPRPPTSSVQASDPSQIANSLFDSFEEFVNLKEIEADWKRWRECTTEEWLKDADQLAQDYTEILNMVKDHMTEKVLAYTNMISSVEGKRTEVTRDIEIIQGRGNIVRENISKLGAKK